MVTISRQSGKPVDSEDIDKYEAEWKVGFDDLFGAYKEDMKTMEEKSLEFEERLQAKYKISQKIPLPKSIKAWKEIIDEHGKDVMIALDKEGKNLHIILLDLNEYYFF